MFDKYKYNNYFESVVDGTGLSNHTYNVNKNCLKRKHKDGKIAYIGKQDCEIKAFKRIIKRIKGNYPKYKFIITADA